MYKTNKQLDVFFSFFVFLITLSGCIKKRPKYYIKSLQSLNMKSNYSDIKNQVKLQMQKLNTEEIEYLFGERGLVLMQQADPIVPLYISISNNSDITYEFDPDHFELSVIDSEDIIMVMQMNCKKDLCKTLKNGGKVLGVTGGAGIITTGLTLFCIEKTVGYLAIIPIGITMYTSALIITGVAFKALMKYSFFSWFNSKIKRDIRKKTIIKKVSIMPGQQFEGLLFVASSEYRPEFTCTLSEQDNNVNKIIFDVDMNQNNFVVNNS